ncbi:MAG: VTT domain-containing protein [Nitrososphaerota archaeon]
MFSELMEWALEFARNHLLHYGPLGLAVLSFSEAVFFPVPPDVLLIPLVLIDPANGPLYGLITVAFSVAGGLFGYLLGRKVGRPLLVRLVGESRLVPLERYFQRYGVMAVGLAAFTPLPYKAFTVGAGALGLRDLRGFTVASLLGRAGRFVPESVVLSVYGDRVMELLLTYIDAIGYATLVAAAVYLAFTLLRRRARARAPSSPHRPS